ncbi:LHS1 [[Candida] subhashii]|uniref:LHS1 n=1 Tax=[Candida] subhashii TaxID=561895 RepID=A0A8J5UWE3_9ASCO|nr:LHS1 [[Candida] subhashii]KAG7662900.1 LHS1 [[Candida] subhashii]
MRHLLLISWLIALASSAILGVDYGQQYSKAVLLAPGIPFEIVLTDEGKRKDLSGLCIRQQGHQLERTYGSQMGSLITRFPQSCVLDLKALIGKKIDDPSVSQYSKIHPGIKLVGDENRGNSIKFDLGLSNSTFQFSVEELLAMTLSEFKQRALNELENSKNAAPLVDDVIIAIPPFSSQATRQAYLDALKLAGFSNVLGLVEEGTSVALNFASNKKFEKDEFNGKKQYHLVLDVGAGYTTATLFSIIPNIQKQLIVEMESVGSDSMFGGSLLTDSVYSIISQKFLDQFNLKNKDITPKLSARLYDIAEKAKIVLSANNEYSTTIESIYDEKDFRFAITRQEFEDHNADLIAHVNQPIIEALKAKDLSVENLTSVILNGGSSRVPFVQKHVSLFVGEEKISKSVNTDESSALGTTLRGLNIKTGTSKNVVLVEKNHYNFGYSVNGKDVETVFAKGSIVGNVTRVNVGPIENQNVTVELYEDGSLFKSYTFDNVLSKYTKHSCKSKQTKELFISFELNENKMFDLTRAEIECVSHKSESFFDKLLHKKEPESEDESEDESTTASTIKNLNNTNGTNNTVPEPPKKKSKTKKPKVTWIMKPEATYPRIKPLSRTDQRELSKKLEYLNKQDDLKVELDALRNRLESSCYGLRSFIDDNEDVLQSALSKRKISTYSDYVSEVIEWLDFESDDASIEDIEEKLQEIKTKKDELDKIKQMAEADLSHAAMKKIYDEGSKMVMKIQSKMLDFGQSISEIRAKYDKAGFNFDKENDRIKLRLMENDDKLLSFDRTLEAYREILTEIGQLVDNPDEFDRIPREHVFDCHYRLGQKIADMVRDLMAIEGMHAKRTELFESQFERLTEREKQREFRKKLREASKSMEEEAKKTEEAAKEEEEEPKKGEQEPAQDEAKGSSKQASEESTSSVTDSTESNDANASSSATSEIAHDEL